MIPLKLKLILQVDAQIQYAHVYLVKPNKTVNYYLNVPKTKRFSNTLFPYKTSPGFWFVLPKTSHPSPRNHRIPYTPDHLSSPLHSQVSNSVATDSVGVCLWSPSNRLHFLLSYTFWAFLICPSISLFVSTLLP